MLCAYLRIYVYKVRVGVGVDEASRQVHEQASRHQVYAAAIELSSWRCFFPTSLLYVVDMSYALGCRPSIVHRRLSIASFVV